MGKEKSIQSILDKANLYIHKKPLTKEEIEKFGTKDNEVPYCCIEDCKRIVQIIKDRTREDIGIGFAYDLWSLHSYRAFCKGTSKFTKKKYLLFFILFL